MSIEDLQDAAWDLAAKMVVTALIEEGFLNGRYPSQAEAARERARAEGIVRSVLTDGRARGVRGRGAA